MGVKIVKKEKLVFSNGLFFHKGKLVGIDRIVASQLNALELLGQQFAYLKTQPEEQPAPSLEGFEFDSALVKKPKFVAQTPFLEKAVEDAHRLMAEIDAKDVERKVNEMFFLYAELIEWCAKKKVEVFTGLDRIPPKVDCKYLGNPLELEEQDVVDILIKIASDGEVERTPAGKLVPECEDCKDLEECGGEYVDE